MTANEIIEELRGQASESYRNTMLKHGASESTLGVSVEYLKKVVKRIKCDYQLALDLYDTGVGEAQYLAGLIADDDKMTRADLTHWVETAPSNIIRESTIAWVAAGSPVGYELALDWIESPDAGIQVAGWSTLSSYVGITPDDRLDLDLMRKLLNRVADTIHSQENRVRHAMNGFVICVGGYVTELTQLAKDAGVKIGKVKVDVGDTACKVADINEYIGKMEKRGNIGIKRKTAKC